MKLVIDTNILLVSISPKSKRHWILQHLLNEKYILCVTSDILNEYEEIISIHMGEVVANYFLQILENAVNVQYVNKYYKWELISEDPDDNKFVDCAIASNANYLVSNDKHFNVLKNTPFPKVNLLTLSQWEHIIKK